MVTMHQLKKNNSKLDFIIVGQGIAGSVLALSLIKAGYTICVINQPNLSNSSKIAAGIWNPIVFKRLTKSWLADNLIPELLTFYEYWEKELNTDLIYKRSIIKPFTEDQEKALWLKKANDHQLENSFLDKQVYENLKIDEYYLVKSYSKVLQAGNLDVAHFLESTKNYIKENQNYIEEEFDYSQLVVTPQEITYKNITAKNSIFCDGHLITKNPYFNWIPMKPAKGETLTIHCPDLQLKNDIFNKGFFMMPLGNDLFKVGATYEWEQLNDIPTEKGKSELTQKLNSILTSPYKIVSHDAGIRPSVIDRRPVVGEHPNFKNLFIFNGLGTKAVMLAPYFAKQLVNYIHNNSAIDSEVNPARFKKEI
jgi:glycine/D-amino acid oxidase-like deaminating enzyme